jgi:hypothetical protein
MTTVMLFVASMAVGLAVADTKRAGAAQHVLAAEPSSSAPSPHTSRRAGRKIFLATPVWHELLPKAERALDQFAVPFLLHQYLLRTPSLLTNDLDAAVRDPNTLVYVAAYTHGGVLTKVADAAAKAWFAKSRLGGNMSLELQGGTALDLTRPLNEGRVVLTSFGAQQRCFDGPGGVLLKSHLVYYDSFFGSADPEYGVMAMPYSVAARPALPALGAPPAARDRFLLFVGRTPKPYIVPGVSNLRQKLLVALSGTPDSLVGSSNWNVTFTPYATTHSSELCAACSYSCKVCYWLDKSNQSLAAVPVMPAIGVEEMALQYESSRFTVVARGDSPMTSKLGEALLGGSIPVILIDSSSLPLEHEIDYEACAVRIDVNDALNDPSIVLRTLRAVGGDGEAAKRRAVLAHRHLAQYEIEDGAEAATVRQLLAMEVRAVSQTLHAARVHALSVQRESWILHLDALEAFVSD